MSLTLVVMAAGLGRRFGGPKQLEPVGPSGETLIDYALFDGQRAGFDRAVLVVREELITRMQPIADRHASRLSIALALQPMAAERPRGTVPAVLTAAADVDGAFSAVNADDFYGQLAYGRAAAFLRDPALPSETHAVIAYELRGTLPSQGGVVRAVCDIADDALIRLEEIRGVEWRGGSIVAGARRFSGDERVSMNFWAFQHSMLRELASELDAFSRDHDSRDELLLPETIDALIARGRATIRVLDAPGPWLGLTHPRDLPAVRQALRDAAAQGEYPSPIWK